MRVCHVFILALLLCFSSAAAENEFKAPPREQILRTLNKAHPRLMFDAPALAAVKQRLQRDPLLADWFKRVKSDANKILKQPPSTYEIPDGRRLLSVSRRVKERVRTLAFVHAVEPDARYVERVWRELEAAAKFKDWNPSHFLDTAEMTHAFALGYDWLHHEWSAERRRVLREAIIRLGLKPALKVYQSGKGWPSGWNNWNQVCNGGIGMGALALADEEPALAADILQRAISSLPRAMAHYAPDGASAEGATYWDYGCRYNVIFLSGLESALGTDFGLSQIAGFGVSGDHQMYLAGASRQSYNFADCGLTQMSSAQHFWLGRRFNRPQYSWFREDSINKKQCKPDVLDLLWHDAGGRGFDPATLALDKHFRGVECASMRSAWNDPHALAVGLQAGDSLNLGGHRHLDLGSFIFEAQGVRWAIDSGSDHETYMSHQHHNPKWKYYRIRAEGHNTLVINPGAGPDQEPRAQTKFEGFTSTPKFACATIDLTPAYATQATRVRRTLAMHDRQRLALTDDVQLKAPGEVWWFMHTTAQVKLSADGKTATLSQSGKQLTARVSGHPQARFSVMDAAPLPTSPQIKKQASNEGRRKLALHFQDVTTLNLKVEFTPLTSD